MTSLIAVIDDDKDDLDVIQEAIELFAPNAICRFYDDPCNALEDIENNFIPQFIILDINMPQMRGDECLKQLRQKTFLKDTKIIMHSTTISPKMEEELMAAGATSLFRKPSHFDHYQELFAKVLV